MSPIDFCYWLNGFLEIENPEEITKEQLQIIKDHLKLVFTKVTPDRMKIEPKKSFEETLKEFIEQEKKSLDLRGKEAYPYPQYPKAPDIYCSTPEQPTPPVSRILVC